MKKRIVIEKTSLEGISVMFAKNVIDSQKPMCASWKKRDELTHIKLHPSVEHPTIPVYLNDRSAIFIANLILKGLGLEFPVYSINKIIFIEEDTHVIIEYID